MSEQLYHRRCFLNETTGAAMVEVEVTNSSWTNDKTNEYNPSYGGSVHLTDCSRSIELDFGFDSAETARDALRKLDRLIDAAQGMRDALARAAKREWPGRKF